MGTEKRDKSKRITKSRIMLLISVTVFGTLGVFVKGIPISSGELAFYRASISIVLIGIFLIATGQRIEFRKIKKTLPIIFVSGAAIGFNWILLFEAYKYTSVSIATISYYFAPVIVTLLSPVLFGEKMSFKKWLAFIMSTVGIVLITLNGDLTAGSNHLLGILFGLGAACLYATVILLNKYMGQIDGIKRTFLQFIAAAAVLLPYVIFTGGFHISSLDGTSLAMLLTVSVVHTGITYCIYFSSLKELPGQEAAILSYIDPLVAVLCSALILKESITVFEIIGGALILGFTLFNEISLSKEKDRL